MIYVASHLNPALLALRGFGSITKQFLIMNKTETDNKLIAEFMGIKPTCQSPDMYSWNDAPFFYCVEKTPEKVMESVAKYAKYHASWDWLMPVVKKITNIFTQWDFEDERREKAEEIIFIDNMVSEFLHADIEAIHGRCTQFIQWYNENKE